MISRTLSCNHLRCGPLLLRQGIHALGSNDHAPPFRLNRTSHPDHVLVLTALGTATLTAGETALPLAEGVWGLCPAGRSYEFQATARWQTVWLHLRPGSHWEVPNGSPVRVLPAANQPLATCVLGLLDEVERSRPQETELEAWSTLIRTTLERTLVPLASAQTRDEALLAAVIAEIRARPALPWSPALLATRLGVAQTTLARQVRQAAGEPTMALIQRLRFEIAEGLLLSTDDDLARIATATVYASAFSFSKAFTRHYGCSPSSFRKEGNSAMRSRVQP